MRSSILLIVVGVWIVARTVIKDDTGTTLVGRILGLNDDADTPTPSALGPVGQNTETAVAKLAEEVAKYIENQGGTSRPTSGADAPSPGAATRFPQLTPRPQIRPPALTPTPQRP